MLNDFHKILQDIGYTYLCACLDVKFNRAFNIHWGNVTSAFLKQKATEIIALFVERLCCDTIIVIVIPPVALSLRVCRLWKVGLLDKNSKNENGFLFIWLHFEIVNDWKILTKPPVLPVFVYCLFLTWKKKYRMCLFLLKWMLLL